MLLWLWCRLAATAPVGPLAWEPPYAEGSALKKTKKKKKKNEQMNEFCDGLKLNLFPNTKIGNTIYLDVATLYPPFLSPPPPPDRWDT